MHYKHIVYVLIERKVPLRLNYSKYGDLLTEDNLIRLAALLLDYSTREPILAVRNIVLENPAIKVRVSTMTCERCRQFLATVTTVVGFVTNAMSYLIQSQNKYSMYKREQNCIVFAVRSH